MGKRNFHLKIKVFNMKGKKSPEQCLQLNENRKYSLNYLHEVDVMKWTNKNKADFN